MNLLLVTLTPEIDPDVALVNVGYSAVAVEVSLVTVTPDEAAAQEAVVPFDVNTYPFVPIPSLVALLAPLPRIKSPAVVIGLRALNAAEAVVCPVPPEAIGSVPVVKALVDVAYKAPPDVNDVKAVPPLEVPKVPANVTAPVVEVLGVNPLSEVWNEVTAPVDGTEPHVGAPPVLAKRTCPVVPADVTPNAEVPLPYTTPLAVNDVTAVPPDAIGSVPLVNDEVDVAYKAPPEVNDVNPVPP